MKKNRINKECVKCGKTFAVTPSRYYIKKYCSYECRFKPRKLIIKSDHALVPLTQGKFAIIDLDDINRIKDFSWFIIKIGNVYYAIRYINRKKYQYMHRDILKPKSGLITDHINGNGIDNRKQNLRLCTKYQNSLNRRKYINGSSKFKGVYWRKDKNKWYSSIKLNGKNIHLGCFVSEIEAAKAYDEKAKKLFGEFARLNFPRNDEQGALLSQQQLLKKQLKNKILKQLIYLK